MQTFIALLKGINVGGHKKVPMAELRELLTKSGFENARTYIQSGNVVFQSSEKTTKKMEKTIKKVISGFFGFENSVLAMTRVHLKRIFQGLHFQKRKKKQAIL